MEVCTIVMTYLPLDISFDTESERGLGRAVLAILPLVGERRGELKANSWLLNPPPLILVGVVGIGETKNKAKIKQRKLLKNLQVCVIKKPGDGGTPPGNNLDMYASEFEPAICPMWAESVTLVLLLLLVLT